MSSREREGVSGACPHCQAKVVGTPQLVGRQVVCPKCKQRFQFGETAEQASRSEPSVCSTCGEAVERDASRPAAKAVTASTAYWLLRLLHHESHVLASDPDGKTLRSVVAKEAGRSAGAAICRRCFEFFDAELKEPAITAVAAGSASAASGPSAEDRPLTAAAEAWQILQGRAAEGFALIGIQPAGEDGPAAAGSEGPEKKPKVVADAFDFLAAEEADKQEHTAKQSAPKFVLRCFRCDQQAGTDASAPRGLPCPACHSRLTVTAKPEEAACLRLADVAVRLAEWLGEREDWETAASILRGARQLRNDHPIVLVRLGESLLAWFRRKDVQGELAAAIGALEPTVAFEISGGNLRCLPAEIKSVLDLLPEAEARLREASGLFEGFHRAEQMSGEVEELRGKRVPELMAAMRASAIAAIKAKPAPTCAFCKKAIEKPVCIQVKPDLLPVWLCKECERPFRKEASHAARGAAGGGTTATKLAPKPRPTRPGGES